jgi:hypothetical protein
LASLAGTFLGARASLGYEPFGTIEVAPAFELQGAGTNIDSIAFWEAPNPAQSLMFVTAKGNDLVEVWRFPFEDSEETPLRHWSLEDGNVNGAAVDQATDRLYIAVGTPSNTVSVFELPDLRFTMEFHKPGVDLRQEPNLALAELANGQKKLYLSADDVVYVHDPMTGAYLDEFHPEEGLETMVWDFYHQVLYIPDESSQSGVYAYEHDGSVHEQGNTNVFGGNVFTADAEGTLIYTCRSHDGADVGCGLILVADQRTTLTDFEIFDRESWQHLGALRVSGVDYTDGVASTQIALPGFPLGIFTAVDSDRAVYGVGWDAVFEATGLQCSGVPTAELVLTVFGSGRIVTDPPGKRHRRGTDIEFTAIAEPGFEFLDWSGALAGHGNPASLSLDADARVGALFIRATDAGELAPSAPKASLRAHPNPTSDSTRFVFSLDRSGATRLSVSDLGGRIVRMLLDETIEAGSHAVVWDGRDARGRPVAGGAYFARLTTPSGAATIGVSLVK